MLNLQIGLNVKNSNIQTGLIHRTDFEAINEVVTLTLKLHSKVSALSEIELLKDMFQDQFVEAIDDTNQILAKMEAVMGFAISHLIKETEGL